MILIAYLLKYAAYLGCCRTDGSQNYLEHCLRLANQHQNANW